VKNSPAGDDTFQGRLKAVGISDHENEVHCMDLLFAGRNMPRDVYFAYSMAETELIRRHRLDRDQPEQIVMAIGKVTQRVRTSLAIARLNNADGTAKIQASPRRNLTSRL
jgi:hypothetical protein